MYDMSAQGVDERMMNVHYYQVIIIIIIILCSMTSLLAFRLSSSHSATGVLSVTIVLERESGSPAAEPVQVTECVLIIIIILDNFCIALFSGVPKLIALYTILQHFLSFTNIIHIMMTTNKV